MSKQWVVLLRGVNVGKHNRMSCTDLAAEVDLINIGAVGTFVTRPGSKLGEPALRAAIEKQMPIPAEIMICPADEIRALVDSDPFAGVKPDLTRYLSVLAKAPARSALQGLPPEILAIQKRYAIVVSPPGPGRTYPTQILEKLGHSVTTRNWNTIEKVAEKIS